jgi:hypothetical protein
MSSLCVVLILRQGKIWLPQSWWVSGADCQEGGLWDGESAMCISKWLSLLFQMHPYQRHREFASSVWKLLAFWGELWDRCSSYLDGSPNIIFRYSWNVYVSVNTTFVSRAVRQVYVTVTNIWGNQLKLRRGPSLVSFIGVSLSSLCLATFEPVLMRSTMMGCIWWSKLLTSLTRVRERKELTPQSPQFHGPYELRTSHWPHL